MNLINKRIFNPIVLLLMTNILFCFSQEQEEKKALQDFDVIESEKNGQDISCENHTSRRN